MALKVGETNLKALIANMEPILNEGEYVFVCLESTKSISRDKVIAEFKEKEGITIVMLEEEAKKLGLSYEFVASWITLNIHSSLEAVGLTAAFSTELAKHNISCNVMAGYYHDHIFVATKDKDKAVEVLHKMAS